ncbi:hypothetical protein [Muricomes intestini]|jgi:hypothetical protein|uniref:hypothetical protein n=1 Tax=Muricomes intestini TaxID=1796634 RepID=UPI002FDFB24B
MNDAEKIKKQEKIMELLFSVDFPQIKFFDLDSDKMLDEKIQVLEALKAGKTISEIPKFYDVLELMPKDEIWD